jgi:hypothetical protein
MLLLHGSKRFGVVYIAFRWRKSYEERYSQFDLIKLVRNRIFKWVSVNVRRIQCSALHQVSTKPLAEHVLYC